MMDKFKSGIQSAMQVVKYIFSLLFCCLLFASADYVKNKIFSGHRPVPAASDTEEKSMSEESENPIADSGSRGLASVNPARKNISTGSYSGQSNYVERTDGAGSAGGSSGYSVYDPSAEQEASAVQNALTPLASASNSLKTSTAAAIATTAGDSYSVGGSGYMPTTDTSSATSTSVTTSSTLVWGTGTWGTGKWGP